LEVRAIVLASQYHDSVSLMLAAKELRALPGVRDAALVMGTQANQDLLEQAGLATAETRAAKADDLIIVVKCAEDADKVLEQAQALLLRKSASSAKTDQQAIHSSRSALRAHPAVNLAVVSVAGAYAAREAREALAAGLHVLLFSDNVSLEDELVLKKFALSRGLLLMGPGAGTAVINGVGLGFANKIPSGPVGIVSAAGTGLQEVSTILARHGVGVSQAIGTGGRDLRVEIGGLMARAGLQALIEDPHTRVIVLVGKPADPAVMDEVIRLLEEGEKPAVVCLLGAALANKEQGRIHFTNTLEECALCAASIVLGKPLDLAGQTSALVAQAKELKKKLKSGQKYLRGLFSGGTLCYEAQVILKDLLPEPVYSNAPLEKAFLWDVKRSETVHCLLDLGEEEYTVGRPHPMIDNDLRVRMIRKEGGDPRVGVVLLDVVLGFGAHPDPAADLGAAVQAARQAAAAEGREVIFIASVTGTAQDAQGLDAAARELASAGLVVCASNAQAARLAGLIIS